MNLRSIFSIGVPIYQRRSSPMSIVPRIRLVTSIRLYHIPILTSIRSALAFYHRLPRPLHILRLDKHLPLPSQPKPPEKLPTCHESDWQRDHCERNAPCRSLVGNFEAAGSWLRGVGCWMS